MADYKNFFELNNPLNIYNPDNPMVPVWQTAEYKEKKLQEEEDERWKKILLARAAEQATPFNVEVANNFVNSLLEDLNSGKFDEVSDPRAKNARGIIEPIKGTRDIDDLYNDAQLKALYSKDLKTGEYRYPEMLNAVANAEIPDILNNLEESVNLEKDVTNLLKDFNQFQDTGKSVFGEYKDSELNNINTYRDLIAELLVERGLFQSEEEAKEYFDSLPEADKSEIALGALGRKYFKNDLEMLEKFIEASNYDRLAMLVSKMKANPFYLSENEKYKSKVDAMYDLDITGPLARLFEALSQWGHNIQEENKSTNEGNPIIKGALNFLGAAASLTGGILGGVWSLLGDADKAVYGELTNDDKELTDKTATILDTYFIEKESQELADNYIGEHYNLKQRRAEEFDALSKLVSPTYKLAMGTDLIEMPNLSEEASEEEIIDAKLRKLAEIKTREKFYGKAAADKSLDEFWKDTTAGNQGALDYIMNTAGVGATSLGSDLIATAAVISNFVNPYMYSGEENDSGYSDALLKHNVIMDFATGVQKYGEKHFHTYKTSDEENSFISARDIPDLIGQYGFTMGAKYASMAGSAAVRSASTYAAKKALERGILGTISRGLIADKGLRETLKAGLKAGKGTEEYTKALEAINQIQSKRLYNLNLAVGAAVGTSEGALEAQQTYEKFKLDNNIDALFDLLKQQIEEASVGLLLEYMKAAGYLPAGLIEDKEGGSKAFFSPELYAKAKQELLAVNEERRKLANNRLEDDALDAAATNFMFNSLINGAANVLLKESLLSDDVKTASRRMKGKTKGITDLIDVVKSNKGWEARVKDAVKGGNKNIWKNIGAGTKKGALIAMEAAKSSFGEALEEYGQTISDDISRAALQADLNNYLDTVYDTLSHEAFNVDLLNIIDTGLNALNTSMTSKEALKSGLFGFLSTMAGGINYGGLVTGPVNLYKNKSDAKFGTKQWLKDTGKNVLNAVTNLYDGAIPQAYKESKEDGESALKLAENVNEWLNNSSNLELLTHLGGAIGFKKLLENSLISRDDLAARDDKLGLAIENIFMLRALAGTLMADAYQKSIDDLAALADITTQEAIPQNFDELGNYTGEDKLAKSAISAFKEKFGQASDNMTDLLIMQRVSQNAIEFKELQLKIDAYSKQVELMYHEEDLDPIVQLAYVQAMIQLDKARSRRDNLKARVEGIFDRSNENLTSEDLALIDEKSGLDKATINTLAEYGSLKKANKALENLKDEINKIEVALAEKPKNSTESELELQNRNTLKWQEKLLKQQKKQLELLIAHVLDAFNRRLELRHQQQAAVNRVLEGEERPTEEVVIEGTIPVEEVPVEAVLDETIPEEVFTAGDMVDMSARLRSTILSNRNNFSTEQLQEIDKFLTLSRKLLAKSVQSESQNELTEDLGLTNEEVIADYIDLSALDSKVSSYDNYLYDYIQNPQFLNIKALSLKEKQRKKTLQFYYKDDLKLKPDETVLDMLDRINEKVETLRQIGRTEDVGILESLINENPVLKKMRNALRETEVNLVATIAYNPKWKDKEKEVNLALTALRTIISSSGMSLKEIKGLFDALDTKGITRELLKQHKGRFLLNTQLENAKLETILTGDEVADETTLNPILQTMKDILDEYYNTLEVNEKRGQSLEIETRQPTERRLEKAETPANPPKKTGGKESDLITVITPGSTSDSRIANFLATRKASTALDKMPNPGKVKFMVTSFYKGVTFVVVPKGKKKNIKGDTTHLFEINGECYQVIGYIENGKSPTLDNIADSMSSSLSNGASRILQNELGDIEFSINVYGEAKSRSYTSRDNNNPPPLNEKLDTETKRNAFAEELVSEGTVEEVTEIDDVTGDKVVVTYNILYKGYPVTVKKVEDETGTPRVISLFNIPLTGLKLKNGLENPYIAEVLQYIAELLRDKDSNLAELNQVINDLRKFKFFETFFNTWSEYQQRFATLEHPWEAATIYNQLIGAFIYLGKPYEKNEKYAALHPLLSEDRKTLTISSTDLNSTVSIPIPNIQDGNPGITALQALVTIFNNTLGSKPALHYHNPTLSKDIIEERGTRSDTKNRKKIEAGVIEGLLEFGVLYGYLPEAIDRSISLMNPFYTKAKGVRASDPNLATPDNSRDETKKPTLEERIRKELTEGLKKAKAIVERIQANSRTVELPDTLSVVTEDEDSDQASYYEGNGTLYARVTSTEAAAKGHKKGPVLIEGRKKVMSTSHGNTVDAVVRTVIDFLNNSSKVWGKSDAKALYEEITKNEPFKGGIPNYDKSLSIDFLKQLIEFYNIAQSRGWTIVPNGIKAFGTLNVFNETGKVGTLPTAGTLDLLLYDEDGKFFIVDIKTMHKTSSMNAYREEREEGWTIQINDYLYLLQQQYSDMEFTGLNYVLSFAVDYKIPGLRVHLGIDRMTILNDNNVPVSTSNGEPQMVRDNSYAEGVLLPIKSELLTQEDIDKFGLDYQKLTLELREMIIPFQEESSKGEEVTRGFEFKEKETPEPEETFAPRVTPAPKKSDEKAATVSLEDAAKSRLSGLLGKGKSGKGSGSGGRKRSQRTIRQARFTDFINNHITPLKEVKVNIFGKIKLKINEFLDTRDTYQKLMISDLANTFFQGNVTQMNSVLKGLKVTPANMPKIIERLKAYFETYIGNEDTLIYNALKRQQSYKALYDYLKGDITEALFLEELYRLNVEANDMPELIDYINSTDKENERRRIILKLETSTIHTEKDANASIDAIKRRIDNMRTKLEFLSLSSASGMLNRRMESIKNAIGDLNISTLEVQTTDSMKHLLNGEDKIYGADNLLSHIVRNSKNAFFRQLASTLLSYIRQQNISITISLDDLMLNVEGESIGRNITIYKDSLDSYEHLERVLLHEMLHSVLLVSPKIKNQLTGIIEKATANIARSSGKTIGEVKKSYYGLTNVDEFISEFFTNYAFLEILKTVPQDNGDNTTASIIDKLIKSFSNKNTVYDLAYKIMKELLMENSLEEMIKSDEIIEDIPYIKHLFKNLKDYTKEMIKLRGITEEEFNNMTAFEQLHLEECCK